jgi:hypothetical protein
MATHFAELTTNRSGQTNAESIGMEEAQENYSHPEKSRWMDVHLGREGTNSNGHGEERNEDMNMAETRPPCPRAKIHTGSISFESTEPN